MNVTIEQHRRYLAADVNLKTELPKILNWIDAEWRKLYLPWLDDKNKNKLTEDGIVWKWLVSMFSRIPDGKKTKVFIYQIMVLNNIANDGVNGKEHCPLRHRDCSIQKRWLSKLGRDWTDTDLQNICGNLAICIRMPDAQLHPFKLDFPDGLKNITIDDRILRR